MVDVDDLVKHSKKMHLKSLKDLAKGPSSRNGHGELHKTGTAASALTLPGLDIDSLDEESGKLVQEIPKPHHALSTETLTKSLESMRTLKKIKRELQEKKENEKQDRSIRRKMLKN